jgi:hypothetical protein
MSPIAAENLPTNQEAKILGIIMPQSQYQPLQRVQFATLHRNQAKPHARHHSFTQRQQKRHLRLR